MTVVAIVSAAGSIVAAAVAVAAVVVAKGAISGSKVLERAEALGSVFERAAALAAYRHSLETLNRTIIESEALRTELGDDLCGTFYDMLLQHMTTGWLIQGHLPANMWQGEKFWWTNRLRTDANFLRHVREKVWNGYPEGFREFVNRELLAPAKV